MNLFDLLFPKRCVGCSSFGSYVCADCFAHISFCDEGWCLVCQKPAIGGITHPCCRGRYTIDGVFSSLAYRGIIKKVIYRFKYPPYLSSLAIFLGELFYEGIIQQESFMRVLQGDILFVPIPLHTRRFKKRGYNQSEILAQQLGVRLNMTIVCFLERIKNTNTQVGLSRKEREANIRGAFRVKESCKNILQDYRQIFLIDDVVTSGATLKEAAMVLKKAGAKNVYGLTLAHGVD